MSPEDRIFQQRYDKIAKIEKLGFQRYPHRYDASHTIGQLRKKYDPLDAETLELESFQVCICGRLTTKRRQGKAGFANLKQNGIQVQIYVRRDEVSEQAFELYKILDAGDLIGVEGRIFRTRTGELTVRASSLEYLAKGILPLPEKFHGLQDVEIRYRQRSLDLISNDSVRDTFVTRDRIIRTLREAFARRDYIEVETPMMQPLYGGAMARPFLTHHNALDVDLFLRIAPELYLKRLIIGGLDRVYEINRNFRNEGLSRHHNPEFTMLEFYEAYSNYMDFIQFSEELLRLTAETVTNGKTAVEFGGQHIDFSSLNRLTLHEAVAEYWPDNASRPKPEDLEDIGKIRELAQLHNKQVEVPLTFHDGVSAGEALLKLFEASCEARVIQPTAVYDYPIAASPLSKQKPDNPAWVERFEIFCAGMEIANGYSELNDPEEQMLRFKQQVAFRAAGDAEAHQMDEDYLRALCYGMPPTAGEGVGIDRLTMILTDSPTIRDVILFPLLRPESNIGMADRLKKAAANKKAAD